jgi:DNA processing protein
MRVAEPPAFALHAFVDVVGPVEAAERIRRGDVPERVFAVTEARRHLDARHDFDVAAKTGLRLLVPEDPAWPAWQLLCLGPPTDRGLRGSGRPLGLWLRGTAPVADLFDKAVSVVGARDSSAYGEYVAAELGCGLVQAGMTVISGAALGIDTAGHRGAIFGGGPTVAVLACGLDRPYQVGHPVLLPAIAEAGLIISEYPPGTRPGRHRFLVRNRLIAALSSATVVVEAGVRSGARNTAATALALGKVLLAVPGPITAKQSVGCHDLLRSGAAGLAASVPEILEAVGPVGENLGPARDDTRRHTDGLADQALQVHEALHLTESRGVDEVAVDSGVPLDRVRALLPELELTGHVTRHEDGWRQARGGD